MKKWAITLIACLACFQSAQAVTSALVESVREFEAIANFIGEPSFTTIGQDEFIVDIKRITRHADSLGKVKYEILTRLPIAGTDHIAAEVNIEAKKHCGNNRKGHNKLDRNTQTLNHYTAKLTIEANHGIGPNTIAVDSIVKVRSQTHKFFDEEALVEEVVFSN